MPTIVFSGLHSSIIHSILELSDKRIATGSADGSLSISTINYNHGTITHNIIKLNAHKNWIESLCELKDNKIASASLDTYIKIWKYDFDKIKLSKVIKGHNGSIWKLFISKEQLLFSSSEDNTIKIWETKTPYKQVFQIEENDVIYNIIISKYRSNLLITSCGNGYLRVWDTLSYQKVSTIPGLYTINRNGIIELSEGFIAISTLLSIVIVNIDELVIVKCIQFNEFNFAFYTSSLSVFDDNSFIYVYNGKCVQISNDNYGIIKISQTDEDNLRGYHCLITIDNGNYIISENKFNGFSLFNIQNATNIYSKNSYIIESLQKAISELKQANKQLLEEITLLKEQNNISNISTQNTSLMSSITNYQHITDINSTIVTSILELSDKQIAIGSLDGSITLGNFDYTSKQWQQTIKKENAHLNEITSLCELPNSNLISGSVDSLIKIWTINYSIFKLIQIQSIYQYGIIAKIIPITFNRFASCSNDGNTVSLWNSISYEKIETPFENQNNPSSLLQLTNQDEVLVINCWNDYNSGCLKFYNLSFPYQQEGIIQGVFTDKRNGLIELFNGHIATSCCNPEPKIFIVDPFTYEKIAMIIDEEYILNCGPLCVLNENSFLYGYRECLCEIAFIEGNYKIVYKNKKENQDIYGSNVILKINNGSYLISDEDQGLNMFNYKNETYYKLYI